MDNEIIIVATVNGEKLTFSLSPQEWEIFLAHFEENELI